MSSSRSPSKPSSKSGSGSFVLSSVSSSLSSVLRRINRRSTRQLVEKTRSIDDVQTRVDLIEYLQEEIPGGEQSPASTAETEETQELIQEKEEEKSKESIQQELEKARSTLETLQEKEAFVGQRLKSYQNALLKLQNQQTSEDDNDSASAEQIQIQERLEQYQQQLQPIETLHAQMLHTIQEQTKRIKVLEQRQIEFLLKENECEIVLETLLETQQQRFGGDTNNADADGHDNENGVDGDNTTMIQEDSTNAAAATTAVDDADDTNEDFINQGKENSPLTDEETGKVGGGDVGSPPEEESSELELTHQAVNKSDGEDKLMMN